MVRDGEVTPEGSVSLGHGTLPFEGEKEWNPGFERLSLHNLKKRGNVHVKPNLPLLKPSEEGEVLEHFTCPPIQGELGTCFVLFLLHQPICKKMVW